MSVSKLYGLRPRTLGRATHTYVVISVEAEQMHTVTTPTVVNSLNPEWHFDEPLKIAVYPSSTIRFTVYRQRRTHLVGDKHLGILEAPLFTYIDEVNTIHQLDTKDCLTYETGSIRVHLEVDTEIVRYGNLEYAGDKIQSVKEAHGAEGPKKHMSGGAVLRQALVALDQLVDVVDGIAEIHPWCKTAWALLSCVTKAIRYQHEQDRIVRELIDELEHALAYTRECRDIQPIPDTTNVIKSLAKLVAEGATLIDGYMRHHDPSTCPIPNDLRNVSKADVVTAKTIVTLSGEIERIKQCQEKLRNLQTKLQWHLMIRTYQYAKKENVCQANHESQTVVHAVIYPSPPSSAMDIHPVNHFAPPSPASTSSSLSPRSPTKALAQSTGCHVPQSPTNAYLSPPTSPTPVPRRTGYYAPPSPASPCYDLPPQQPQLSPAYYYFPPYPFTSPPEILAGPAPPPGHWCCAHPPISVQPVQHVVRHNSDPLKSQKTPGDLTTSHATRIARASSWCAPSVERRSST
ncbi:hypothetical protein EIP86_009529 [Pleurotus ostreatoroseus]|nr:hypothetical protein EIP86_009529 [Pleurotus ostreatoroseus]